MMNFDEARRERESKERTFQVGGREFRFRAGVAPETILRWSKARAGEIVPSEQEWLDIFDETILAILEPGQEETWREIRSPDREHPLSIADLSAVLTWLFGEISGRPTGPEPSSTRGSGSTEPGLKAVDSSPEATASTG